MPKKHNATRQNAVLQELGKNLKKIEKYEANFILQKAKLKKSVANYKNAKQLIQICKDNLKKYIDLINIIETDIKGNNSREREAKKILSNRKKDIIDYDQRLKNLKENRKNELYGPRFNQMFKKGDLKKYKNELKDCIDNFNLTKAGKLNTSVNNFIEKDLKVSEEIMASALTEAPKIKISIDNFKSLSKILSQEIGDLTAEYAALKAKRADSESIAGWVLKWAIKSAASGIMGATAGYVITHYLIPTVIPALYEYVTSYVYD